MKIALVGGGKAALTLLDFFSEVEHAEIVGISDIRDDAPGIVRARTLGIATTTKTEELVKSPQSEIIIELTGNAQVKTMIAAHSRPEQEIMSANCAKLMCDIIEAQSGRNSQIVEKISKKFNVSMDQLKTAIEKIDAVHVDVEKLLREAGMVTLNAKIESARAGDAGNAFAIVVDRMHEMLGNIRNAMDKIIIASVEGHDTLAHLNAAKNELIEEFRAS
jgi:hypothetical protein